MSKKNKDLSETSNESEAKKENKFVNLLKKCRFSFETQMSTLKTSGAALVWTVLLTFIVMVVICLLVFFTSVQGAEKVMVPNVIGKTLTNALLEMQDKELYPKIQLRYSDEIGDAGKIIEQNPEPGAIVKAYRRVTLTVSRGEAVDEIDDYIGQNIEEVAHRLNQLFNNEYSLVTLAAPVYRKDENPAGTIIMQTPEPGAGIYEPVTLYLIVSSGEETPMVQVPDFKGLNIRNVLTKMEQTNLLFNFTGSVAKKGQKAGTVISQTNANQELEAFSKVDVDFVFAEQKTDSDTIQGIFKYTLNEYPFPVPVSLVAKDKEGKITRLVKFNHPGKEITIPYEVKKGTTLTLYVLDEKENELLVQ